MLYYIRYLLLSTNSKKSPEAIGCFNDINRMDEIPQCYFVENAKIGLKPEMDVLEKALKIARYLRTNILGGPGLGLSSDITLQKMLGGSGGVCSDFCQIFNIFCFINDIKVKEWGCIDQFYKAKFGHSFNEIYSEEEHKWIAIDVHKSILFTDADGAVKFSVMELFSSLRKGNELNLLFFSGYIPKKLERLKYVYSRHTIPFLITNYKNSVNDYFLKRFKKFPPFVINGIMFLYKKNHTFVFVMNNYKLDLLPKPLRNFRLPSFH